jgi:RNA polymerase sigma-70 factor (ECF subfamily)
MGASTTMGESSGESLRRLFLSGIGGHSADYAAFLRGLAPVIRRIVRQKIVDAEVEDVVQEVLISVHKARHTYDGVRNLMPWVYSIVHFRLNDHLREHYRHHADRETDEVDFENFFADVTNQGSDREYIEELMEGLTEAQQKILVLLHVEGYTAREVAGQVGMNESAVKVAAHRAIQKIRKRHGL